MVTYKGNLSLLVAFPFLGQLVASFDLAGLAAEIAGLVELTATFTPPSVVGILGITGAVAAALQAGFQPPAFDLKASLGVKLGLLKAKYELLLKLSDLLASGSLRVYEYAGPAGQFGPELASTLAGADDAGGVPAGAGAFAVVLLAEGGSAGELTLKTLHSGA